MKIVVDMNLSPRWRETLEKCGHDCVHWSEVGEPGASERTIMAWAMQHGHVILTHDLDFGAILAATQAEGPSVVQMRIQDVLPASCGKLLTRVLEQYSSEIASGSLIVVDETKARVRILPLVR